MIESVKISMISAVDQQGGIGVNGNLPWACPDDMTFFKMMTMGHCVIMGRSTYESCGALKGRFNLVLSRKEYKNVGDNCCFTTFEHVVKLVKDNTIDHHAYVIGGEEIYKLFYPHADQLIISKIPATYKCDRFFPKWPISAEEWDLDRTYKLETPEYFSGVGLAFNFYKRRSQIRS